ncbi:hypothetical protein DFJ58DRAFT_662285 [Suillus subalutaceus]|uniref:uncharacterized protein n=1 Tax=Suillus subalutaceus TaxID=48586 RepID=UPI001B8768D7|nr:uncharacterized protein DFJ58DRAFT_662285 [Suillus subalutaceus]KAG1849658.1 hypothetical protein DFJ58DRAFT_662285 [Suillus subalutaceus]
MNLASRLSKVIQCLQDNGLSTSTFMSGILESSHVEHQDAKLSLRSNASQMCTLLNANEDSHSSVLSWAIALVHTELCREVAELSLQQHGLHFRATSVTVEQLETLLIDQLAMKMKTVAPHLWNLMMALLDSRDSCWRKMPSPSAVGSHMADAVEQREMDLGEFSGDSIGSMGPGNDDSDDESEEAFERRPKKRQRRAAERNEALLVIVSPKV